MKRELIAIVLSLYVFTSFYGCIGAANYLNDGIQKYPPSDPEKIKVYSARNIDRDFIEIGYVAVHNTAGTGNSLSDGNILKEEIRKEAAKIGADAVVGFYIYGFTSGGVAVRFK